ncbi:hypothetical protein PFISCL1PPCAC_13174, partial [Pristionchus fissidentatus]
GLIERSGEPGPNVFFYRIFEVEQAAARALDYTLAKDDLNELIERDTARVFHVREWPEGHSVANLTRWLQEPESSGLFYNMPVTLKERKWWEFQFVGLRTVPLFDEHFPYRLDNNLQLRWEICRAGYAMHAINHLFVYHTLDERRGNKDDLAAKTLVKEANKPIYAEALYGFKRRMDRLYPSTKEVCPTLDHKVKLNKHSG